MSLPQLGGVGRWGGLSAVLSLLAKGGMWSAEPWALFSVSCISVLRCLGH